MPFPRLNATLRAALLAGAAASIIACGPTAAFAKEMGPEEIRANFTGAVKNNRADIVRKMLAQGYNPNVRMPDGEPALIHAIRYEDSDVVPLLINANGIDIDQENQYGETALMVAAFKENIPVVKALMKKGAIVDRRSGWSPLHYAAGAGSKELVKLFLDNGADPNVRNKAGVTPLFMAARIANRSCIELLLKADARKDLCNDSGQSPADMIRANATTVDTKLADLLAIGKCAAE